MNVIQEIERINARELAAGIFGGLVNGSWHDKYRNSAWVYIGGLSYDLTEGDVICVMSQWGEIEDINLVRDKGTGKSLGYGFVKYEDQRSTILAVDNFNNAKLLGRSLRCDHVDQYKLPKEVRDRAEKLLEDNPDADFSVDAGHAYASKELQNEFSVAKGMNLWESSERKRDRDGDLDSDSDSDSDDSLLSYHNTDDDAILPIDSNRSNSNSNKHSSKKKHKKDKKSKKEKKSKKNNKKEKKRKHENDGNFRV